MNFGDLINRDFTWLSDSARDWSGYAAAIDENREQFRAAAGRITGSGWKGAAADQAAAVSDEIMALLETRRARAAGTATVLSEAYQVVKTAQNQARREVERAEAKGFRVDDHATVTAADPAEAPRAAQIAEVLRRHLHTARTRDEQAALALRDLVPERPGYLAEDEYADLGADLRQRTELPEPPNGIPEDEYAAWWNGLSSNEQTAYIYAFPDRIGGMNGAPAEARHDANMILLREDVASGHDREAAARLLDRVEQSQYDETHERIYLLRYDPPGADGSPDAKVVAAFGNPDTADHTAINVPGTGTDLGDIAKPEHKTDELDKMDALHREASGMTPGSVSTIVWLGYDAPDDIKGALMPYAAKDGAVELRDFTEGLRASHQGEPSHTTVIGHSYGSTVVGTGDALGGQGTDDGLETDEIIAVGSPGMGYESPDRQGLIDSRLIDNTSDMHTDADHIWAALDDEDWIRAASLAPVHGFAPTLPFFGAEDFSTDGAHGHSDYYKNNESRTNMARIMTGNYDDVT